MLNLCFGKSEDPTTSHRSDRLLTHQLKYPCKTPKQNSRKGISKVSMSPRCNFEGRSDRTLSQNAATETQTRYPSIRGPHISLHDVKKKMKKESASGFLTQRSSCVLNPDNPLQADREGNHRFGVRVNLSDRVPILDIFLTVRTPTVASSNRLRPKLKNFEIFGQQTLKREYRSVKDVTFAVDEPEKYDSKMVLLTPYTRQSQQLSFIAPNPLKFNRQQINTVYSQYEYYRIPVKTLDLNRTNNQLKLASSSKCRLAESNINQQSQQRFIYYYSLVYAVSIMNNFKVLQARKFQHYELIVAVERNIGLLLLIKKIGVEYLEEISHQLLLSKILKDNHPSIITFYQCIQNENREYLMLQEYYYHTLDITFHLLTEADIAKLSLQMLEAFEFLIYRSVRLYIGLHNVAYVHGIYKLCNMESWSRSTDKPQELMLHYYRQLSRLIETIYQLRYLTNHDCYERQSLMLKVFLKILHDGTLPIGTLRQHLFLKDATK